MQNLSQVKEHCPQCGYPTMGPLAVQDPRGQWWKRLSCTNPQCFWHENLGGPGKTAGEVHAVSFK